MTARTPKAGMSGAQHARPVRATPTRSGDTFEAMPQVVDLPPIGNDQRGALASLVRVCKDTPAKGEAFRDFRSRLRAAKLWDKDRPVVILRFLGVGGATITPSVFMQSVAAAESEDDTSHAIMDRVWNLNQLLGKTIIELVSQRAYGKDE